MLVITFRGRPVPLTASNGRTYALVREEVIVVDVFRFLVGGWLDEMATCDGNVVVVGVLGCGGGGDVVVGMFSFSTERWLTWTCAFDDTSVLGGSDDVFAVDEDEVMLVLVEIAVITPN